TTHLWAVGWVAARPLIERWNGTAWRVVRGLPATPDGAAGDVVAISGKDVWVRGAQAIGTSRSTDFTERWDGSSWSLRHTPLGVFALAAFSEQDLWGIGSDT